jgi:FkbM family methyltransferase
MLIHSETIIQKLSSYGINITGAFHIGAHDCEELGFYHRLNLTNDDIVWIEAIPRKVEEAHIRNIPNVFQTVITDKDDEDVVFHVSNNVQSSSVLELGTHAQEHPQVYYTEELTLKTITISSFFERNGIDPIKYNFWNFDIQGAELMALKGATKYIEYAKAIYLEVNEKELYKGCGLIGDIDAFLAEYHFTRVLTNMTSHGWGDALYILQK